MEEQIERIETAVELQLTQYLTRGDDFNMSMLMSDPESRDHVVRIGKSILCTKWGVGAPGGSFVQAVVANDLQASYGRADHVNQSAIRFYCYLVYNQSYVD